MLQNNAAFNFGQRHFRIRRQNIGVGVIDRRHPCLEPINDDLGGLSHHDKAISNPNILRRLSASEIEILQLRSLAFRSYSQNAESPGSCVKLRRMLTCKSRTSVCKASSAWRRDIPFL